jgi:hypothetical protein
MSDLENLAKQKLPIVQIDYRSYFDAASRVYNEIYKMRQWSISIVSAGSLFLGRYGGDNYFVITPILILAFVFWALDARSNIVLDHVDRLTILAEEKLSEPNEEEFQKLICNWEYGKTLSSSEWKSISFKMLIGRMTSKTILFLHGSIILVSILLFLISTISVSQ